MQHKGNLWTLCYSWFYHTWWITLVWHSLVPLQTLWTPWNFFIPLMFSWSSLKTCLNCYMRLLNPFSHIYIGLTPKTAYIGMCAEGQIILEFSLTWIQITCLLAFHMPWYCLDSTLHFPIEELYKEPFGYIEEYGRIESKETIVYCCWTYALVCIPLSLGALWCSSQAFLLLVSLLSRDGGLRWWRPKWGI